MGVWIEMFIFVPSSEIIPSLPLWECGLKYHKSHFPRQRHQVTPFVGVWIEIAASVNTPATLKSLPLWECGLKWKGKERYKQAD